MEGKALGLETVVMEVVAVSGIVPSELIARGGSLLPFSCKNDLPLFSVPQTSQVRSTFLLPDEPSRRLPQSVQKTRDPMAAMMTVELQRFAAWKIQAENCSKNCGEHFSSRGENYEAEHPTASSGSSRSMIYSTCDRAPFTLTSFGNYYHLIWQSLSCT